MRSRRTPGDDRAPVLDDHHGNPASVLRRGFRACAVEPGREVPGIEQIASNFLRHCLKS